MSQLKGAPGVAKVYLEDVAHELGMNVVRSPKIRGYLTKLGTQGTKTLQHVIKTASGYFDVPGHGTVPALINEALDAFFSGGVKGIEEIGHLNDDQLKAKADEAVQTAMESLLDWEGIVDSGGHWHPATCPRFVHTGRGKNQNRNQNGRMTLGTALRLGIPTAKDQCMGHVHQEIRLAEEEELHKPSIFELCERIENGESDALAARAEQFREGWTDLNAATQKRFVLLAEQDGAENKLRTVLAFQEDKWDAVLGTMVKLPAAPAAGTMDKIAGAFGKIGEKIAAKIEGEGNETNRLFDAADTAMEKAGAWNASQRDKLREKRAAFIQEKNQKPRRTGTEKIALALCGALFVAIILTAIFN